MLGAVRCETSADRNSVPLGPHASLVGLPLSTFEVRTGTESFVRLEDPSQFDDVNVGNHTLPLYVRGTMTDGDGKRVRLVVRVSRAAAEQIRTDRARTEQLVLTWMSDWRRVSGSQSVTVTIRWGDIRIARGRTTPSGDQVTIP